MTKHRTETVRKTHCSFSVLYNEKEGSVFTVITDKVNRINSIQKIHLETRCHRADQEIILSNERAFRTNISQFNPAHTAIPSWRSIVILFSAVIQPSPLWSLPFRFPKCRISWISHLSRVSNIFHPPHFIPLDLVTVNVLKKLFDLVTSRHCRPTLVLLSLDC